MYQQNYYFNKNSDAEGIFVTPDRLYTKEAGYGFVTEKNRDENRDCLLYTSPKLGQLFHLHKKRL